MPEHAVLSPDKAVLLVKLLIRYAPDPGQAQWPACIMGKCLDDPDVRRYLDIHEYQGVAWFNREAFEHFLAMLFAVDLLSNAAEGAQQAPPGRIQEHYSGIQRLFRSAAESGYRCEMFKQIVS